MKIISLKQKMKCQLWKSLWRLSHVRKRREAKPLTPEEKAKLAAWKAENIKKILIVKCMVEFLYEKKLITLDNEAHPNKKPVRTKDGYRTRTIVVAPGAAFDLSILPVRLMLPMVGMPTKTMAE